MDSQDGYHCKNLPLDSLEELMMVKGMTPEALVNLRDYVTIYPKTSGRILIFD